MASSKVSTGQRYRARYDELVLITFFTIHRSNPLLVLSRAAFPNIPKAPDLTLIPYHSLPTTLPTESIDGKVSMPQLHLLLRLP